MVRPARGKIGYEGVVTTGGGGTTIVDIGENDGKISSEEERTVMLGAFPEGFTCKTKHAAEVLSEELSKLHQTL